MFYHEDNAFSIYQRLKPSKVQAVPSSVYCTSVLVRTAVIISSLIDKSTDRKWQLQPSLVNVFNSLMSSELLVGQNTQYIHICHRSKYYFVTVKRKKLLRPLVTSGCSQAAA